MESILDELQDSHLNSANPWRFDKVTRVFNDSIKSSKLGYFNCLFSKLHNSAKSWSFFKKLGSFELLMVWTTRKWSYLLNLTHFRPFYGQITRGVQLLGQRLYIRHNHRHHATQVNRKQHDGRMEWIANPENSSL